MSWLSSPSFPPCRIHCNSGVDLLSINSFEFSLDRFANGFRDMTAAIQRDKRSLAVRSTRERGELGSLRAGQGHS